MEVISDSKNTFADKDVMREEEIRIPRPANAFMIFGKEYRKILAKKFQNLSNKQISKNIGRRMETNGRKETKTHYHKLAEETHRQHLNKYPGILFIPLSALI